MLNERHPLSIAVPSKILREIVPSLMHFNDLVVECYVNGRRISTERISSDPLIFEVSMVEDKIYLMSKEQV
jgi:hypothetical protein